MYAAEDNKSMHIFFQI